MFKNGQWAVTDYGLEAIGRAPWYAIEARRLDVTTMRKGAIYYDWPIHMAEKPWVKIDEFIEAFLQSLAEHSGFYCGAINPDVLRRTIVQARWIARFAA